MAVPAHVIALGLQPFLNAAVRSWFKHFNFLPPIPMSAVQVDAERSPKSLEHLLTLMAASSHKNFILIVHGYSDGSGLTLHLSHTHPSKTNARVDHFHLQRLMDLANPLNNLPAAEEKKLGLSERAIDRLNELAAKVRAKKIECIEFRACNLGKNPNSLERFRQFFGARVAGAPDLHSFFGGGPVQFKTGDGRRFNGQDDPRRHDHGRARNWETYKFPYWMGDPNLVCCFEIGKENKPTGGHVVADDAQVLDAWVKKYLMANGQHTSGDMPIHGLWVTGKQIYLEKEDTDNPLGSWGGPTPRRPIFPLSENYRKHVIYARGA
jgi:hypothetical protein